MGKAGLPIDDDGVFDGVEDANQNGAIDTGETDPSNPSSYPAQTTIYLKKGFDLIAIPADVTNQPDLKDWLPVLGNSSEIENVMVYDKQASKFVTLIPDSASNSSFILKGGAKASLFMPNRMWTLRLLPCSAPALI